MATRTAPARPFRGQEFVLDIARAMYQWAADRQRGDLLPEGFANPFFRVRRQRQSNHVDQFGQPDITLAMAQEFFSSCDLYQLRLFAPIALYGLRPSELCFLFREHIDQHTLVILCQPDLDYLTKGGRDKRLPLVTCLETLLVAPATYDGVVYLRRRVAEGIEISPLARKSRPIILTEFKESLASAADSDGCRATPPARCDIARRGRNHLRPHCQRVQRLHRCLKWPTNATLKDFRHLCSTCLENAGSAGTLPKVPPGSVPWKDGDRDLHPPQQDPPALRARHGIRTCAAGRGHFTATQGSRRSIDFLSSLNTAIVGYLQGRSIAEGLFVLAPFGIGTRVRVDGRHCQSKSGETMRRRNVSHQLIPNKWVNICILQNRGERVTKRLWSGDVRNAHRRRQSHKLVADGLALIAPRSRQIVLATRAQTPLEGRLLRIPLRLNEFARPARDKDRHRVGTPIGADTRSDNAADGKAAPSSCLQPSCRRTRHKHGQSEEYRVRCES